MLQSRENGGCIVTAPGAMTTGSVSNTGNSSEMWSDGHFAWKKTNLMYSHGSALMNRFPGTIPQEGASTFPHHTIHFFSQTDIPIQHHEADISHLLSLTLITSHPPTMLMRVTHAGGCAKAACLPPRGGCSAREQTAETQCASTGAWSGTQGALSAATGDVDPPEINNCHCKKKSSYSFCDWLIVSVTGGRHIGLIQYLYSY